MNRDPSTRDASAADAFDTIWRDRGYLLGMATRMLRDAAEAEDAVQEAFVRLGRVELDEIADVRGWLAVVVRRLCLDRIRSARARRESAAGAGFPETILPLQGAAAIDPADRVTLDDQVQRALAIVLDRLTPAERTAFVLHDVFGLSFDDVGEIVGRTPTACRQLASRARHSIRTGAHRERSGAETTTPQIVAERFIAACAGGDIAELVELLDPGVAGDAVLLGRGPLVSAEGRPAIAQRLLGFFGPASTTALVPFVIERSAAVAAFGRRGLAAIVRLDAAHGRVHHVHAFVLPPR